MSNAYSLLIINPLPHSTKQVGCLSVYVWFRVCPRKYWNKLPNRTIDVEKTFFFVFTARLHVMQRTVYINEKAVCPSICLSVKRVKRKKVVPTFLYHMKDHSSYFSDKQNCWWGRPLHLKFWGKLTPLEQKRWFSIIISRLASVITPSEKTFN